jgi:hypothetical protein
MKIQTYKKINSLENNTTENENQIFIKKLRDTLYNKNNDFYKNPQIIYDSGWLSSMGG